MDFLFKCPLFPNKGIHSNKRPNAASLFYDKHSTATGALYTLHARFSETISKLETRLDICARNRQDGVDVVVGFAK
jgi:hypothetical protein